MDTEPARVLAEFRNPGDIQRVEESGGAVRYKRVMLLSPGMWTDAGSEMTIDYAPEGIRASADNWVDMDAVREHVPDWAGLDSEARAQRLQDLDGAVATDAAPINFLHGPTMYGADSLDDVGEIPLDSIIVDDDGRLFGDLVFDGASPQSETAIDLMDEVLEAAQNPAQETPPVGPSVEIPADRVAERDRGVLELQEAWLSGVGVVFNPASRPVELGAQAQERAVAMQAGDDDPVGLLFRPVTDGAGADESADADGGSLLSRFRHRADMADSPDDLDLDDLGDADLRRALAETRDDIDQIQRLLEDLGMVQKLIDQAESEGFDASAATVADLQEFLAGELEVDDEVMQTVQQAIDAFLGSVDAEGPEEASAADLRDWAADQAGDGDGDGDDGEGGDGDGEGDEPTMEDLEAAKATIAEFNDRMSDVKDLLQEHREETASQIEDLERRLQDVEDEPDQDSEVKRKMTDFYDDGRAAEADDPAEHEDVML